MKSGRHLQVHKPSLSVKITFSPLSVFVTSQRAYLWKYRLRTYTNEVIKTQRRDSTVPEISKIKLSLNYKRSKEYLYLRFYGLGFDSSAVASTSSKDSEVTLGEEASVFEL